MNFPPESFYTETPSCLIVLLDMRYPEAEERLRREQASWCSFADVERLTSDCSVLIVRPGGATRLAA